MDESPRLSIGWNLLSHLPAVIAGCSALLLLMSALYHICYFFALRQFRLLEFVTLNDFLFGAIAACATSAILLIFGLTIHILLGERSASQAPHMLAVVVIKLCVFLTFTLLMATGGSLFWRVVISVVVSCYYLLAID
jgi:hypothetical protein